MLKKLTVATLSVLVSTSALASDKNVKFRFAHWLPTTHPLVEGSFPEWSESIKKASNGTIDFEFYPAQQLGVAKDHYNMARDGIADVTWVGPGYEPGRFPILGAIEFPFVVSSNRDANLAVHEWYSKYSEQEMPDVKVCITHVQTPGTLHSKKEVSTIEDIAGMSIRPSTASVANYVNILKGTNLQIAAPETRDALEKGSADAVFYPNGSLWLYNLDHIVKYHVDLPMYTNAFTIVFNKGAFNKLSENQQKVINDHCTPEWAKKMSSHWDDFEEEGLQRLREAPDHHMISVSDEEKTRWIEKTSELEEAWAKQVSRKKVDPKVVLEDLTAALEKHNSLFEK